MPKQSFQTSVKSVSFNEVERNKMKTNFDIIVIGVGSMGSATCYQLAQQGYDVLGLEQFDIPHDQGSHAGQSRIIRKAYFEHPDYVPLLQRAYHNWKQIETAANTQVYFPTGLLYAGKSDDALIKGVRASAAAYQLEVESLSKQDATRRFPAFHFPESYEVMFEPDAGFLTPERCITVYADQAIRLGTTLRTKAKVLEWRKEGTGIAVKTNHGTYFSNKLVITAVPWAGQLIPSLRQSLNVTRQAIAWVNTKHPDSFALGNFPCWLIDDDSMPGMYYGFPQLPVAQFGAPIGMKLAYHYPGAISDPDQVNRVTALPDEEHLVNALERFLPNAYATTHTMKTCLYTNTHDEHFVIDFLAGYEQRVAVAAGFSGHGFKFVSVVGEIMADLVTKGKTDLPIDFLSAQRLRK